MKLSASVRGNTSKVSVHSEISPSESTLNECRTHRQSVDMNRIQISTLTEDMNKSQIEAKHDHKIYESFTSTETKDEPIDDDD